MGKSSLIILILAVLSTSSASAATVDSQSDGGIRQWQILTKQNFSSQIRLHPHILLFVSVPWSGESRSLMQEIMHLVNDKQEEFRSLKLMYMHRNNERMLAGAIGVSVTDDITIFFYHHSLSYKYQGIFRARNILSSISPYFSVLPEKMPLERLSSKEDLKMFIESTDKAVLLLEFCGWTDNLMARERTNGSESGFGIPGFPGGSNELSTPRGKENQKGTKNREMQCRLENGFGGIPWLGQFSLVNESAPLQGIDSREVVDVKPDAGLFCSLEEFQKFDSFFSRFMTVAREFFLPPEKHRFGLVSEKSLLSPLGVGDYGSWSVMLYYYGRPSCSRILKEGDSLKRVLQMDKSVISELGRDRQHLDSALPADKPSAVLFLDRLSELSETRKKSKEALDAFIELALQYRISDQTSQKSNNKSEVFYIQASIDGSISQHPKLKLSSTAQNIKSKDKMSIMILNQGKPVILDGVASGLEGSSLHEILTYLLQKREEVKLSSVAREAGFQLLSDDFQIKLSDALPSESEVDSKQVSHMLSDESADRSSADLDKDVASSHHEASNALPSELDVVSKQVSHIPTDENADRTSTDLDKDVASSDDEVSQPATFFNDDEKATYSDASGQLISQETDQHVSDDHGPIIPEDVNAEERSSFQDHKLGEEQPISRSFKDSLFFSDGHYRLLTALTGGTRIPSLVIIDPIIQQHYLFPEHTTLSYSSMESFINEFLNGSLIPYQRSKSEPESPREGTHPPFVNMDFHEADSIPEVTARTFSEQVLGSNQSEIANAANAWHDDVLVLFSNSWCGFCQRMELIVREVHRSIKGYMNMLKTGSRNGKEVFTGDLKKFPKIFLMDCTLSDCSLILKSVDQREVYPTLLLFPAERKNTVCYEGYMAVADVVMFIADHGTNSKHLTSESGILRTVAETRGSKILKDTSTVARERSHEVLLKNLLPKRTVEIDRVKSRISKGFHEATPQVSVGSILVATEKLNNQPFDNARILIIQADQRTGFQGLIYNKHMRWETLQELEQEAKLLKEAPLSFGGPLVTHGMPLVALSRRAGEGQYPEVAPGIYFLGQSATLSEIEHIRSENQSLSDYWFFLGFSSWGWEQLLDEIAQGAWNVSQYNKELLDWP